MNRLRPVRYSEYIFYYFLFFSTRNKPIATSRCVNPFRFDFCHQKVICSRNTILFDSVKRHTNHVTPDTNYGNGFCFLSAAELIKEGNYEIPFYNGTFATDRITQRVSKVGVQSKGYFRLHIFL